MILLRVVVIYRKYVSLSPPFLIDIHVVQGFKFNGDKKYIIRDQHNWDKFLKKKKKKKT